MSAVSHTRHRSWTRDRIIAALQAAAADGGRWLSMSQWAAEHRRPSVGTVIRVFGCWQDAWRAAGIAIPDRWRSRRTVSRGSWTQASISAALTAHARADGTIMGPRDWVRARLLPSLSTINHYYGSYAQAATAAGLTVVTEVHWHRAQQYAAWRDAFARYIAEFGHEPSAEEWDAWPDRPVSSRHIPVGLLLFRQDTLFSRLCHVDVTRLDATTRDWVQRYRAGETLDAIAQRAGITRQAVHQRLMTAVRLASPPPTLDSPITALGELPHRLVQTLLAHDIRTVGDLWACDDVTLLSWPRVGPSAIRRIHAALHRVAPTVPPDVPAGRHVTALHRVASLRRRLDPDLYPPIATWTDATPLDTIPCLPTSTIRTLAHSGLRTIGDLRQAFYHGQPLPAVGASKLSMLPALVLIAGQDGLPWIATTAVQQVGISPMALRRKLTDAGFATVRDLQTAPLDALAAVPSLRPQELAVLTWLLPQLKGDDHV